jgi:phytoene synthase
MRRDARPEPFETINALIDDYIYGSAIVVGYFLAYVYGPSAPDRMDETLTASRELGIALQLTNFIRDVLEDHRRGRLYLPLDLLLANGVDPDHLEDPQTRVALTEVIHQVAVIAEGHYHQAELGLDAFSPDCRVAIRACIDVYRALNSRIQNNPDGLEYRQSVPAQEKWQCLPGSKYWRIPLAMIMARI